jgi:hypothetical protein
VEGHPLGFEWASYSIAGVPLRVSINLLRLCTGTPRGSNGFAVVFKGAPVDLDRFL